MKTPKDIVAILDARLAQIDQLLSIELNEIIHHPSFQKLEGTWRGLKFLVDRSETSPTLQIRILNVSKRDLLWDLQKAGAFDESGIFKKVHDDVYGVWGAAPFGVLLGDYEFGRHSDDIELLESMSHVAATAHAPFISAVAAEFFNLRDYTQLALRRDLRNTLSAAEYARWDSFRRSEDSRYVALCLPRILGRVPYGQQTRPVELFAYEEGVDGADPSKYLWINSAYALGTRLGQAFSTYGWCAAIRGHAGGGLVEHLPVHGEFRRLCGHRWPDYCRWSGVERWRRQQ
jgi:type VI secretion system protein ImpC